MDTHTYNVTLKKNLETEYFECEKQETGKASVNNDIELEADTADSLLLITHEGSLLLWQQRSCYRL
jgi:hypothetical protein